MKLGVAKSKGRSVPSRLLRLDVGRRVLCLIYVTGVIKMSVWKLLWRKKGDG